MVLLVANPLVEIQAVRDVDAVVLAGAYYDRAALDQMLAGVESAAGSWSMWPKFAWQILRSPEHWLFLYGFRKNERSNIDTVELRATLATSGPMRSVAALRRHPCQIGVLDG